MTKFIDSTGIVTDGSALAGVVRDLVQFQARVAVDAQTDITDSSTGSASGSYVLTKVDEATAAAASGSNLAGKATTETALGTVKDALKTLFAKANATATVLGIATVTYNGGGTDGTGTVAAMTKTVTGAATGALQTEFNAIAASINAGFYALGVLVNKLATATGKAVLAVSDFAGAEFSTTVAAIATDTGTAASPGITKAAADAALLAWANNAATVAARYNAVVAGAGSPGVVAV